MVLIISVDGCSIVPLYFNKAKVFLPRAKISHTFFGTSLISFATNFKSNVILKFL